MIGTLKSWISHWMHFMGMKCNQRTVVALFEADFYEPLSPIFHFRVQGIQSLKWEWMKWRNQICANVLSPQNNNTVSVLDMIIIIKAQSLSFDISHSHSHMQPTTLNLIYVSLSNKLNFECWMLNVETLKGRNCVKLLCSFERVLQKLALCSHHHINSVAKRNWEGDKSICKTLNDHTLSKCSLVFFSHLQAQQWKFIWNLVKTNFLKTWKGS